VVELPRESELGSRGYVTPHNQLVPTDADAVSLLRWLRRQLREPSATREHLEAAVANDDPAEARRQLDSIPFSEAQRRHVERLLDRWERR
jgi:hypothetical protein